MASLAGPFPITATALPLPAGAATEVTLVTRSTEATLALLKARADLLALQAQLPPALVGDRLDINIGSSGINPLKAREDTAPMTWVSGRNIAPAANAVQADTGALGAADYDFDINVVVSDTVAVGKALVIEHRNAANGATLFNLGGGSPNGTVSPILLRRYTMAANERIRVVVGAVAGAATSLYVSAIGRRVA